MFITNHKILKDILTRCYSCTSMLLANPYLPIAKQRRRPKELSVNKEKHAKVVDKQRTKSKELLMTKEKGSKAYNRELIGMIKSSKEPPLIFTLVNHQLHNITEDLLETLDFSDKEKKTFKDIGIIPELIEKLRENNITAPLDVQCEAIPVILRSKSVIIESSTGSGKTLAFLLPIIQSITPNSCPNVIIVPTRELATQIFKEALKYVPDKELVSRHVSGVDEMHDTRLSYALRKSKLLIGTPKKIDEIIEKHDGYFRSVECVVLDEVDRLLSIKALKSRSQNINKVKPTEKILSRFTFHRKSTKYIATSATITKVLEDELKNYGFARKCQMIRLTPEEFPFGQVPPNIKHNFIMVPDTGSTTKIQTIGRLFRQSSEKSILVFIDGGDSVEKAVEEFKDLGFSALALYKQLDLPKVNAYETFLRSFKEGKFEIVVANDETVRGLDFPFINQAYLTYIPQTPQHYLHVAGRVGRVGQTGKVTTLLDHSNYQTEKKRLKKKYRMLGVKGKKLEFV